MTVNNPTEPEIQISEEKLQKLGWILFGLAVIFTIIGAFVPHWMTRGNRYFSCQRSKQWKITERRHNHGYLS